MNADPIILRRIDAALCVMDAEGLSVRAIYLGRTYLEDFLAAQDRILRPVHHRGYDVRPITGKGRSCVYSTHGVARAVPRLV